MKQMTLAATGFERYGKTALRAALLAEMERVVPWAALCALIEPVYPKPATGVKNGGTPLMVAVGMGHIGAAATLLELGADPNVEVHGKIRRSHGLNHCEYCWYQVSESLGGGYQYRLSEPLPGNLPL